MLAFQEKVVVLMDLRAERGTEARRDAGLPKKSHDAHEEGSDAGQSGLAIAR